MFIFDLQMFAGEADDETVDNGTDSTVEEVEIPDELAGVSEDVAKEIMAEMTDEETVEQETEDTDDSETLPDAEQDSDNKADDEGTVKVPSQKIPYDRFKEVVDKRNSLEQQLEQYRNKYGDINAAPQQSEQPAPNMQHVAPQAEETHAPELSITPENVKKIDAAVKAEAMRMTGMTDEDIEALEYEDDTSAKTSQWQAAMSMARTRVYNAISQGIEQQKQYRAALIQQHNDNYTRFENFSKQQMSEPDFDGVKNFAVGEFFSKMEPGEQTIVRDSYNRYLQNTASPQDLYCVQRFFIDAKTAYRSANPISTNTGSNAAKEKIKKINQAGKFPKAASIDGSSTSDSVTISSLEDMLTNRKWSEIPEKYQKLLLGEQ